MDAQPDGQKFRAIIAEAITQHQQDHAKQPELVKFRISVNDDQCKETVTYILKGKNNSAESSWRLHKIVGHEGPLISSDHHTLDPSGTFRVGEWRVDHRTHSLANSNGSSTIVELQSCRDSILFCIV